MPGKGHNGGKGGLLLLAGDAVRFHRVTPPLDLLFRVFGPFCEKSPEQANGAKHDKRTEIPFFPAAKATSPFASAPTYSTAASLVSSTNGTPIATRGLVSPPPHPQYPH